MRPKRAPPRPTLPPRLKPIGFIHSDFSTKFSAPHQPDMRKGGTSTIELLPQHNFEQALRDLAGFSHVWLVWWFHENPGWKPLVRPPRGPAVKRGVFATRSPHRPNPLGLTAVELREVRGRILTIGPCDLLDGTPILDIKPYIPEVDSFPHASTGWLESISNVPRYSVSLSTQAEEQIAWLREHFQVDFIDRVTQLLEVDPTPHRTRRILATPNGFRMGCGGWRVNFTAQGAAVLIEDITPGYPLSYLEDSSLTKIPDRSAQRAFHTRWSQPVETPTTRRNRKRR